MQRAGISEKYHTEREMNTIIDKTEKPSCHVNKCFEGAVQRNPQWKALFWYLDWQDKTFDAGLDLSQSELRWVA